MRKYIIAILGFVFLFSCNRVYHTNIHKPEKKYVLLVSFDGFRYDYAEKFNLTHFKKLKQKSSYAEGVLPSFPSKTFPNHYSIITGMYPGNHGIVDNKFYSPLEKKTYAISNRAAVENPNFYQGVPLWQWLQKKGMKTASFFWVGSEAPIQGEYPTYYKKFDSKIPYTDRIEQVMEWFKLPEGDRPRFVTLYFELVDHTGHHTGTNSEELKKTLQEADVLLGKIMEGVEESGLPITTIVTSDHGMIDMRSDDGKIIFTEEIEEKLKNKVDFINNGMHCHVYLKDKKDKEEVYHELKKYFVGKDYLKVYKKEQTPMKWHYRKHPNIGDLLLVVEAPYYMARNKSDFWASKKGVWGTHGYDPYTTPEMKAIFYVYGKGIKENYKIPSFENVHIYPFINKILGVDSPPNIDGKLRVLFPVLKK